MIKKIIYSLTLVSGIFLLSQCQEATKESNAEISKLADQVQYGGYVSMEELGEHLVAIAGCHDCHTPKKMGPKGPELNMERALSGHPADEPIPGLNRKELEEKGAAATQSLTAWIGPWGVSFAGNITSHETGIGNWTLEQFIIALREGQYKGIASNRPLLPPMPSFKEMTDQELEAIFAYLKSTPPVDNVVPQALPPVSPIPN
jgi:mono/diheme cytochrome c family protein